MEERFYMMVKKSDDNQLYFLSKHSDVKDCFKAAEEFYEKNDRDLYDVRCFDFEARPGMYCYWSFRRHPQIDCLAVRSNDESKWSRNVARVAHVTKEIKDVCA